MERVYVQAWRDGMLVEVVFFGPSWLDQAARFRDCWSPTSLRAQSVMGEQAMQWTRWDEEQVAA